MLASPKSSHPQHNLLLAAAARQQQAVSALAAAAQAQLPPHHQIPMQFHQQAQQQQRRMQQQQQQPSSVPSSSAAPSSPPVHKPGMKDVPYWLKTLRLHKYTHMMSELTYEEMMELDENTLEAKGVTKGARRKILQSISKLKRRSINVRRLEATFDDCDTPCLRCAIVELRQLVATPIKAYTPAAGETEEQIDGTAPLAEVNEENLPALMMRLLERVYSMGVSGDLPHEQIRPELLLMYFTICDRMLINEAFTSSQKRRIVQWRRAARRFAAPAELRKIVLPTTPPPRCEACTPVSTFYFNEHLEEILRVQNLQRLVKQYLSSDPSWWQQNPTTAATHERIREAPSSMQQPPALLFSPCRQSQLARKLLPRGGPVTPPPPQPPVSAYYTNVNGVYCHTPYVPAPRPERPAAQHRRSQAENPSSSLQSMWHPWEVYSSSDLVELSRPLDLGIPKQVSTGNQTSVWDNTPLNDAATTSQADVEGNTSGYSSASSERGSGAGSPRAASGASGSTASGHSTGGLFSPLSPPSLSSPEPVMDAKQGGAFFGQNMTVFNFCTSSESNPLDSTCRRIQAEMNLSA